MLQRPIPATWWLRHPRYFLFMLRELSAVFVGAYALLTLCLVKSLAQGPEAWQAFVDCLHSPGMVKLHVVGLIFVLFHAWTWFGLVPKVMVVRVQGKPVPGILLIGAHWLAWLFASIAVASVLLGGYQP